MGAPPARPVTPQAFDVGRPIGCHGPVVWARVVVGAWRVAGLMSRCLGRVRRARVGERGESSVEDAPRCGGDAGLQRRPDAGSHRPRHAPGVVDQVILVDDLSRDDNLRDTFQRYRSCFERLLAT
jgi:hypothetical protein